MFGSSERRKRWIDLEGPKIFIAKEVRVVKVVPSGAYEEYTLITFGLLQEWEDFLLEDNAIFAKFSGIDS